MSQHFCLLSLLETFANTDATQECDKLFALLGIAVDVSDEAFDPDYYSSLETIVRRYACRFVERGNVMDLLYRAGASKSYKFCSWIPEWTGRERRRTISTWRGAEGIFCAAGTTPVRARCLALDPSKLEVYGIRVDSIVRLCNSTTNDQDIISVVNSIHSMINTLQTYPTGEQLKDLKLRVSIGNAMTPYSDDVETTDVNNVETEASSTFNWAEEYSPIGTVQEMINFLHKSRDSRQRSWKYWTTAAAFSKRLSHGKFCITKKGYVGMVSHEARVGDEICVLYGAAVPFVLRKSSFPASGKLNFKLIGEAYIHGIMYGEALASDRVEEVKFTLI